MSQYFENDSKVESKKKIISFLFQAKQFSLFSDNGVFSKDELDEGSEILLDTIINFSLGDELLDVGCGIGPIGIILKTFHPQSRIDMIDVNLRAIELAKENVKKNNLDHVEVFKSDGFENVQKKYDSIITNPPIRAGKVIIYKIFEDAYQYLKHQGSLFIVIRKSHGALSTQKKCTEIFGNCELINRKKGFYVFQCKKNGLY